MPFWKVLLLLIFPGGLLLGAACSLRFWTAIPESIEALLVYFPPVAAVAALLLGWRFNRARVVWVVLLVGLVWLNLHNASPFGREFALAVAPVLLPVNLLVLGWLSERGLLTGHGLIRGCLFAMQLGALVWLYHVRAGEVIALFERPLLSSLALPEAAFSQLAMVSLLLSFSGLLVRFLLKPDALAASFCWALGALTIGLSLPDDFAFWGGTACLILVAAVIESGFSMAFNDELTGLPGRRAMNEFLLKVGRRYTVAMVDVDHFKKVNDTYGHDVGDQVLRMIASRLRAVSGGGRAFRYGGEEFAVIFPGKDLEKSLQHLEILREKIAGASFVLRDRNRSKQKPSKPRKSSGHKTLKVTASIGAAERSEKLTSPEQVIKAADQALYRAKKGGRNRVCH